MRIEQLERFNSLQKTVFDLFGPTKNNSERIESSLITSKNNFEEFNEEKEILNNLFLFNCSNKQNISSYLATEKLAVSSFIKITSPKLIYLVLFFYFMNIF